MRIYVALLCLPLLFSSALAQHKLDEQKGDTPLVRQVKRLLRQPTEFSTGFSEKQTNKLGDKVAVALLQIYTKEELRDRQNVRKFLPLLRSSFLSPNLIPARDKKPVTTLRLLASLEKEERDPALRAEISQLVAFIKERVPEGKARQ